MKWALTTLLLLAMLAGCADEAPAGETEDDTFDQYDLEADASTGVIRGVVVDESIAPVEGALIQIQGTELQAESDSNGAFAFSKLEAGSYFLSVSKVGYDEVQQNAEVVAGVDKPDIIKVLLKRIPGSEPYILPVSYTGFIACEYQYAFFLGDCDQGTGLFGDADNTPFLPVDKRTPQAVQLEVSWDHTQEFGQSLTMTAGTCPDGQYCSPYGFDSNTLCQVWGPEPLWCRATDQAVTISGNGGAGSGPTNTTMGSGSDPGVAVHLSADCSACTPEGTPFCGTACGVGLIIQQDYVVYMHVFYNFLPDEDWIFTVDGDHTVPES